MTIFLDKGKGAGIEEVTGPPWDTERRVLIVEPPPFATRVWDVLDPRYSHRERRRLARHGRKWPKRVPKYRPYVPTLEATYVRYDAHLLAIVANGVRYEHWLYLPDGQQPTDEQLREVTRLIRRALERQLHETWLETMRRERGHDGGGAVE